MSKEKEETVLPTQQASTEPQPKAEPVNRELVKKGNQTVTQNGIKLKITNR